MSKPKNEKGNEQLKRLLIIGGCFIIALLAAFLLIQRSGYKKAEAKFQALIDEKDTEIVRLTDELEKYKKVDIVVLEEQVSSIGELATAEHKYTNAGRFEDAKELLGFRLPWTEKFFTLRYKGTIKVGFDITDPDVKIEGDTIIVTLPQPKILSHEIDFKSAEVLDQRNGLFNPVTVTDVNEFYAQNKDALDVEAMTGDLKVTALTNAKVLLETLFNTNPAVQANYKVEVKTASS